MDTEGTAFAAVAETTSFLHYFSGLPDHRQAGKVDYPLPEVLLLILLAVLAGAEAFTDIARFGERKIELLRRFRPYVNGTPSHDHLGDIFATLDARAFQLCFVAWVAALMNTPAEVISIDGKLAALVSDQGLERGNPHRLCLRRAATHRAGPGKGEREVERDRRHPGAARHDVDRGCGRDDRCDGLPA